MNERRTTTDGLPPDPEMAGKGAPKPINPETGQHGAYWVLTPTEIAKGFVRPVRDAYVHTKCGALTRMSLSIAETYARDPSFYGSTFCVACRNHFPVGANGEFVWDGTDEKVGT